MKKALLLVVDAKAWRRIKDFQHSCLAGLLKAVPIHFANPKLNTAVQSRKPDVVAQFQSPFQARHFIPAKKTLWFSVCVLDFSVWPRDWILMGHGMVLAVKILVDNNWLFVICQGQKRQEYQENVRPHPDEAWKTTASASKNMAEFAEPFSEISAEFWWLSAFSETVSFCRDRHL